jgi:acyl-CoA synthetase (AMP-forming)/AMP-acid ligase II
MTASAHSSSWPSSSQTLGAAFAAACALRGRADFLVDDETRLNGIETAERSERVAAALHAHGQLAGRRIAFLSRPSVSHALTWFSAIRIGCVATNLHLLETGQRLAETITWLEAGLVIHDEEFADLASSLALHCPQVTFIALEELATTGIKGPTPPLDAGAPHDPVAIVLSSGSTGRPKGVVHTNASTVASISAGIDVYRGIDSSDSVLVCIGTSFGGWCNVVIPFAGVGTKLVFQRRFEPQAFLNGLQNEKITIAPLVPTMWRMALAARPENYDLSRVKLAFMSGEIANRVDVQGIQRRITKRVRAAYLSTEGACGCGVVLDEDAFLDAGTQPAGHPLGGVGVRIVAETGEIEQPLPQGMIGEILLRGTSLAGGYWKDADRTAARFQNGWWRSGDTGYLTSENKLVVVGRTDHVINSGGVKIQAEDIEAGLMQHPDVRQAAVVGVPDAKWGQRAEAFVVTRTDIDNRSIAGWCQTQHHLAPMKFLKAIHVVEQLPTGPTGKLYRPALLSNKERSS